MALERLRQPKTRFGKILRHMGNRYVVHSVGLESAALAFYLVFAIFPFLIFISALLSYLQLGLGSVVEDLGDLLPADVARILSRFLLYARGRPSPRLLISSLFLSFWFPMRATNSLMIAVRKAYHLGAPRGFVAQMLKNLCYTLLLMVTVILTVVLTTVSDRMLAFAVENFGLPPFVADLWTALRFPVVAVVSYFVLYVLYVLAQDDRRDWRYQWPGTLAALGGWMLASWLYAFYVNNIAHYSLIFGSIGTMIVLLVWLELSAMVLILGAELNGTLMGLRKGREREEGAP